VPSNRLHACARIRNSLDLIFIVLLIMVVYGKHVVGKVRLFSKPGALQFVTTICTF